MKKGIYLLAVIFSFVGTMNKFAKAQDNPVFSDLLAQQCPPCKPGEASTEGGKQNGVLVRESFSVHQAKYDTATDLHFKLWQEEDNININGWKVCISHFTHATSQRGNQPSPAHNQVKNLGGIPSTTDPDNGQHGVDVVADGAKIPRCTWVKISACFWLTNWNTKRLADVNWTKAKDKIIAGPNCGWTVDWPVDVGGNQYGHRIIIKNDDATASFILKNLKFYPTMTFIDDLDTLSWFPIVLPDIDTLFPGDSTIHEVVASGTLGGGHIYGHFTIRSLGDTIDVYDEKFDHPVAPTGACCRGNVCDTLTWAQCQALGGKYIGNGTACDNVADECPTLTQWGLIILVALLVASTVFVMLKRRKASLPA